MFYFTESTYLFFGSLQASLSFISSLSFLLTPMASYLRGTGGQVVCQPCNYLFNLEFTSLTISFLLSTIIDAV